MNGRTASLLCVVLLSVQSGKAQFPDCSNLDPAIVSEIQSYQPAVDSIIDYVMNGAYKGVTYDTLSSFTDNFGTRLTGTANLENAIDFMIAEAVNEGFDNVYTEDVQVPVWLRNDESAEMIAPRYQKLQMMGLGKSVGTPPEGITAPIIAVESFDELATVADQVAGKIVVYYQGFESYGQSVAYRANGASEAAKLGGLASLSMSAADFSIGSPHTGGVTYQEGVPKVPAAALSVEDTGLLFRKYKAGEEITVTLKMDAENFADGISRNTIIENVGSGMPEKIVVLSGHIDSWDVGAGVMDDAGGCFVSYHSNVVLRQLGLQAQRTVATVLFTAEEQGIYGGDEYFLQHKNNSENYQILIESDAGTFTPYGMGYTGSDTSTCVMQAIVDLTAAINTTQIKVGADTPDLEYWPSVNAPTGSLYLDRSKYFWFHHSDGDTMDVQDPETMDRITALFASVAYVTADMSIDLQTVT